MLPTQLEGLLATASLAESTKHTSARVTQQRTKSSERVERMTALPEAAELWRRPLPVCEILCVANANWRLILRRAPPRPMQNFVNSCGLAGLVARIQIGPQLGRTLLANRRKAALAVPCLNGATPRREHSGASTY